MFARITFGMLRLTTYYYRVFFLHWYPPNKLASLVATLVQNYDPVTHSL